MKTAEKFREELGRVTHWEISVPCDFIRRIQADALASAAEICLGMAGSPSHHDATDCARAIITEAEKLNI